jgi:hypothetical protein
VFVVVQGSEDVEAMRWVGDGSKCEGGGRMNECVVE